MAGGSSVARAFHDGTAHSPASVRSSGHTLAWDIKPFPFKIYTEAPAVPLPRKLDLPSVSAVLAIEHATASPATLALADLATLLYLTAGVTKKKTYPGGAEVLFRAAASTGALYQTEVYVAVGSVEDLVPGLYHFCPGDFTLRRLRDDDVRGTLADAAVDDAIARHTATMIMTGIYWRNTWKYQARGFRHLFWDSGTMLANALAAANALGLAPRLVTGFVDAAVNQLLGVDATREGALELVGVGPDTPAAPAAPVPPIAPPFMPLSSDEVDYPQLRQMYEASSLASAAEVAAWRAAAIPPHREHGGAVIALPPPSRDGHGLGDTIQRRGSTRRFSHAAISGEDLAAALHASARPVAADAPLDLVDRYLVVNAVDGLAPGAYRYRPDDHTLETLAQGEFRRESAFLCLEQPLGGDAAAVVYFLSPLDRVLAAFGDRGYRLVNLAAGLAGGRAYLAAYARGFGATGLTFYDDKVVEFFSPRARGLDAVFVTALGRAAARDDVLPSWRGKISR